MHRQNGQLRKVRGDLYEIKVSSDATVQDILPVAVDKHSACNWHVEKSAAFVLLYPDGRQVNCLPGSDRPFILSAYREFVGKSYKKLRLYICAKDHFSAGEEMFQMA